MPHSVFTLGEGRLSNTVFEWWSPHEGGPGLAWGMMEDFLRKGLVNWALKAEKELRRKERRSGEGF